MWCVCACSVYACSCACGWCGVCVCVHVVAALLRCGGLLVFLCRKKRKRRCSLTVTPPSELVSEAGRGRWCLQCRSPSASPSSRAHKHCASSTTVPVDLHTHVCVCVCVCVLHVEVGVFLDSLSSVLDQTGNACPVVVCPACSVITSSWDTFGMHIIVGMLQWLHPGEDLVEGSG